MGLVACIDYALEKSELPASLWVFSKSQLIGERINKTKMVFLFLARNEKKQHSGENKPTSASHLLLFSLARVTTEISFLPVRVTRISWNWNNLKHCAFVCETFGFVVSMNECRDALRFKPFENNGQNCIESESKRTIETLKNPNRKIVCLIATDCFFFQVHNDISTRLCELFRLVSSLKIQATGKSKASVTLSRHVAYFFRPRQRALLFLVTDQASGSPYFKLKENSSFYKNARLAIAAWKCVHYYLWT